MKSDARRKSGLTKLAERLYDPLQFRILITVVVMAIAYFGVYEPLSNRIALTTTTVKKAQEDDSLAREIEDLQTEVDRIRVRLPKEADTNEWVNYVLAGIRKLPLTLVKLDPDPPRRVGPFQAIVLRAELRGNYHSLESFLHWIDTNERLFRVDTISINVGRGDKQLEMKVTLLGLGA
jgi:Tfp pilus assembly protein PilO